MAVTLAQVSKLETDPLKKGVIQNILRASKLMELVPFENVSSLQSIAVRWTSLPDVAFRRINSGYTQSEGDVEQVYESVYAFGGEMEIDRVFDKIKSSMIKDPRQLNIEMKTMAMALAFANYFINGDHATDADGFEGLKKRIANMPSRQSVRAGSTTDVLDPTASAANARRYVDKWEEAYYRANGGDVQAIISNELIQWGLGRVMRYAGISGGSLLDTSKDQFDREILSYKGSPIIDAGLKGDLATEIVPVNETAEDAGADATSAYFVPFNMEQGIQGIQLSDMEVYDPLAGGERESKPTKLIRLEWWVGLSGWGSHGPTRLHNIETPASWT